MKRLVLRLDDLVDAEDALHPAERAHAQTLSVVRRKEFVAGRTALRRLHEVATPILSDDRGAPILPPGLVGSISHTRDRVAAAVAPDEQGWRIGIDIEKRAGLRYDIADRVLVPAERARLSRDALEREGQILLAFSIKEAIYKAIDPFVRRYVGFQEVELELAGSELAIRHALPLVIEASFEALDDATWLATARARDIAI